MAINGFGLLSLPVAMGTMHEVAKCCGPSPKAFLLMAPVESFFVDRANAVIARGFLSRPFLAIPPLAGG
jgi:sodium--glutamate symport carrier gltS